MAPMIEGEPVSGFPGHWYVAFMGAERAWWWDWLSPPGFRHVMAFAYAEHAQRWLVYDVTHARTFVRAFTVEAFPAWLCSLPPERTIVVLDTSEARSAPVWRLGFWCTIAVAHLLGIRTRALRPVALYRDLVALGARPAFEPEATP